MSTFRALASPRRRRQLLASTVIGLLALAFSRGVWQALAAAGIHPDQWLAAMIGEALSPEWSSAVGWMLAGSLGLLAAIFWPRLAPLMGLGDRPGAAFHLDEGHLKKLGKPLGGVRISDGGNTQQQYEKAGVVWLRSQQAFFIYKHDPQEWRRQEESATPDDKWFDPQFLREKFSDCPDDREPPWAGIAVLWDGDPEQWKKRLGWRRWLIGFDALPYQSFENGIVIGGTAIDPRFPENRTLILFDDGTWQSVRVKGRPKMRGVENS